jgi:glycosyltransferase involved in cell wall biosynthesis
MLENADGDCAISIVVPCFDRITLLERTLRACFAQVVPDGLKWEIIVCDNHPDQLAKSAVEALQKQSPVPFYYLPAPSRNIARARNVGVAAAKGRYVAFIDDDEAPDPGLLAAYYSCLERTGADAAFGPKYPIFESGKPPSWDPEGWYYTTNFMVPTDTRIGRVGRQGRVLGSGNSFMRVATCLTGSQPFDEVIGAADGEDTELFLRLLKNGRSFVWCAEASVHEVMLESRMNFGYMRLRMKRGSECSARCRLAVSEHKLATHLFLMAAGLAQFVVHGALFILTGEFLNADRVRHRLGMARGLGKLTYRWGVMGFIEEKSLSVSRL